MNLRVYLSLLLGLVLVCSSNILTGKNLYLKRNYSFVDNKDSIIIAKKITQLYPTYSFSFYGVVKQVPLLIDYEVRLDSDPFFEFRLVDFVVRNNEEVYIKFNDLLFSNNSKLARGYLFFLPIEDLQVFSIEKIREDLKHKYQVTYNGAESIVYTDGDDYYCVFLKYQKNTKEYVFFYDDTASKGMMNKESKLDFIIESLRIPKVFMNNDSQVSLNTLRQYEEVLTDREYNLIKEVRNVIQNDLKKSKNGIIEGKEIIAIPLDSSLRSFWEELSEHNLYEKLVLDTSILKNRGLEGYIYGDKIDVFMDEKERNYIVLSYVSETNSEVSYVFLSKAVLEGKEVLVMSDKVKSSALFWMKKGKTILNLRMLESLPELK